jgi:hypothetical protein
MSIFLSSSLLRNAKAGFDLLTSVTVFQRELTRLLTERGLPPGLAAGGETARIDGGSFEARPGGRAEGVGRQVVGAVYGGLKR